MSRLRHKLIPFAVSGILLIHVPAFANKAPVAVDDAFSTLQGKSLFVGSSILETSFEEDAGGYVLNKDTLGTFNPSYITGQWKSNVGYMGGGGLQIKTGPTTKNGTPIGLTSGTWNKTFTIEKKTLVNISIHYRLKMAANYEVNEFVAAFFGIDGQLIGNDASNTLLINFGDGNGGNAYDSGWRKDTFSVNLSSGEHTLWAGIYSNNSTAVDESAEVFFDNIFVQPLGQIGVILNDVDEDDDNLVALLLQPPANGNVALNSSGSFTYNPNPSFAGVDTFQYRVFDGTNHSNAGTVRITVDGIPIAGSDQYTIEEDLVLSTNEANGILHNDLDPENAPLTPILITPTAHGILELLGDGTFTYTPMEDYHGEDRFTYKISDGLQDSAPATVTIVVTPVDDLPRATPDNYNVNSGLSLDVDKNNGVLANDSDPDGPALAAELVSPPDEGTLDFSPDGSFRFIPPEEFSGTAIFSYRISTSPVGSTPTQVRINVSKSLPRIVINEVMYNSVSANPTEEFIELYNNGTQEADLSGWRFTKGIDFTFPAGTTLGIDEYLVVAAEGLTFRTKYPGFRAKLLASWSGKLANSGETIQLEDAEGQKIDEVSYSNEGSWANRRRTGQDKYGRNGWIWEALHDGHGHTMELMNAAASNKTGQNWTASKHPGGTPGYTNSKASLNVAPFISKVRHHPPIPSSTNPVLVTADVKDDNGGPPSKVLLYWRVDGTPTYNQLEMRDDGLMDEGQANNLKYGASIPAQANSTIIEFYVEANDGQVTRTWPGPTDESGTQGANCLYRVDNAASGEAPREIPCYRVIMTASEQAEHNIPRGSNKRFSDAMVSGTFISSFNGDIKVRYLAGIRYRGSSSRKKNPPSLHINLPRDDPWENSTRLNLNSDGWYNQLAGSAIFNQLGLPSARATAVSIHINGQNQYPNGYHVHLQPLNSEFTDQTFPKDSNGNLYRGRRSNESPAGGRGSGLVYHPGDEAAYGSYTKLTNSSIGDWSDVIALTKALSELEDTTNFFDPNSLPAIHNHLNVDQWLRYFALHAVLSNTEGGLVEGDPQGDDYSMYSGVKDPRFMMVSHDLDSIMSDKGWDLFASTFERNRNQTPTVLDRLINHPQIRPRYLAIVKEWCEGFLHNDKFKPFLEKQISPAVPASRIRDMLNFMEDRTNHILHNNNWLPSDFVPPPLKTVLDGIPDGTTPLQNVNIWVSGKGVTHYRYRINKDEGYSISIRPVEAPIILEDLEEGQYTVYVRGMNMNANGTWQYDLYEAQSETWTVKTNYSDIRLHEILANNLSAYNHENTFPDYVEIVNAGTSPVSLQGLALTDDLDRKDKFTFGAGMNLNPGEHMLLHADSNTQTSGVHLGFRMDSQGETLYLLDGTGENANVLDQVTFGLQLANISLGRNEEFQWVIGTPTPGNPNQQTPTADSSALVINEWLADGAFVYNEEFIELYNPTPLPVAIGGFHLTDNPVGNPDAHRITPNSYIPARGYVTFLPNGKSSRDARHLNFQLSAQREMISFLTPELQEIDTITFGPQKTDVSQGRTSDGAPTFVDFTIPTPGKPNSGSSPSEIALINQLRITEIMYNPIGGSKYEYLELKNIGESALDLSGVQFTNGISHTFSEKTLAPGEVLILVNNMSAYEERYGTEKPPAGEYNGKLSNGGEKIRLETPSGLGILEFEYKDSWDKASDGDGFSLEISNENEIPKNWGDSTTWRAGNVLHGSPGEPEPANTAPTDILIDTNEFPLDLAVGELVGTLSTVDTYPRDSFTYVVTAVGTEHFRTELDRLILIKALAKDQTGPFNVGIRVTDSYGASFFKTLEIKAVDPKRDDDYDELPDEWESAHFGNLKQSGIGDYDGDGQSNLVEYLAGTDPTDSGSQFTIRQPLVRNNQFIFTFEALPGRSYRLEAATSSNLSWETQSTVPIREGTHEYTLPVSGGGGQFYRIVIEE